MTEVFILMRNNAIQNRNMYEERVSLKVICSYDFYYRITFFLPFRRQKPSDNERLLQRSLHDAEEGLEMRDDYGSPPVWIDKLEEAQYTISK